MRNQSMKSPVCLAGMFRRRPAGTVSAVLLCALTAAPLCAQSLDYGALEELFGEPVTTSVTGSPQRASNVPATMEILTAADIRRSGARDLPDLLHHVTGIDSLRWSNSGVDLAVRGYNKALSARVLVLVDGRQVYVDHYGYTPWSALPVELDEIRQIEVVKGPNSALFGFNAVGGVINIVTYDPGDDDVDFVTVRGGTQAHREISAGLTFGTGTAGTARITGGARRNDAFVTPAGLRALGMNGGEERNSLRLDTHYTLGPAVELAIEASYTNAEQPIMVPTYTMGYEDMLVRSMKVQLSADTHLGLIGASIYRNWIDDDVAVPLYRPDLVAGIGALLADIDSQMTLAQLQDVFKIGSDHVFRLSGEYRESQLHTLPVAGATVFYDVTSGSAMWTWQVAPTLSLTNALRVDYLDLGRRGMELPTPGLSNAAWNRTLSETSYNIGLVWDAGANDVIRLVASRGAQLPNLFDLGGNLSAQPAPPLPGLPPVLYISGLPNLEPTSVSNYEIAWDKTFPGPGTRLKIALFRGTTRDVLTEFGRFDVAAGIFNAPANIGESEAVGVEATLSGTVGAQWRWRLGYIHEEIDDTLADLYPAWRSLTNFEDTTPQDIVNADVGWSAGSWTLDAFLHYQSAMEGLRANAELIINPGQTFLGVFGPPPPAVPDVLTPVASYVTVDIRAGWTRDGKTTFSLTGRNLLHKQQRQTAGLPVERSILATVTAEF